MKILGYNHKSYDLELLKKHYEGRTDEVLKYAEKYDGFEDWPWPLLYKELDSRFPGSKFILTTRITPQKWYGSLVKHSERTGPTEARKLVYGYTDPHHKKNEHIRFYNKHNAEVRAYFHGRDSDFIELCWERGDGWEKLCRFLDKQNPDTLFPHANKSPGRLSTIKKKIVSFF
ncbi:hypothetical protein DDZ15_01895 [Rhodohalobacter mucosus]|uniref:Sulfotransferase family protein n=2 Tax=Rhodohalobacter mucosus TaxID=2079485 RepID=A0A316TWM4_9BACT|nr:hypothetical protein DDZ15_01895 [Rhodohalobacter mucosus]